MTKPDMKTYLSADDFLLFVYGTLMRGGVRHRLLADQRFVGEARTLPYYALFDFGTHPGMVLCDGEGDGQAVAGELYAVAVNRLPQLDAEEGAPTLFRRECVEVEQCPKPVFAYLYQRSVKGILRWPSGRWIPKRVCR
jgi:gamma-glutamylcyclotransferase (GGCT)/AIG2-like uncharacterized protein YtfP